jgi:hypothetical protein
MQDLIAFADQAGRRITLSPAQKGDPNGTTSRSRLVAFYKRLGFKENKGRSKDFTTSAAMVREPATLKQGPAQAADQPATPTRDTIELRKRESVLKSLLECLGA